MNIREIINLFDTEKRKKEKVKAAQEVALGMGVIAAVGVAIGVLLAPKSGKETREGMKKKAMDTVETIADAVHQKAEAVKGCAANAAKEVVTSIKDVHGKTEDVKKDIKDGCQEVTHDVHKTAENISKDLNDSVK